MKKQLLNRRSFRGLSGVVMLATALVAALAVASTASSAPQADVVTPDSQPTSLQNVFDEMANASVGTEFQQSVLEEASTTGEIAQEDYLEGHSRYVACMESSGFTPNFRLAFYGAHIELPYENVTDAEYLDSVVAKCSTETGLVTSLYTLQEVNPDLVADPYQVAVSCLVEVNAVGIDYDRDKLVASIESNKFPFDPYHGNASDCMYAAGFAYFTSDS